MIAGVIIKPLVRPSDERGWFQELARETDANTVIRQVSAAERGYGIVNGWHIHEAHSEWVIVLRGIARLALHDLRRAAPIDFITWNGKLHMTYFGYADSADQEVEIVLSEHDPKAVYVPPGVAHGYRILSGPCLMIYASSEIYNPDDEGRIAPDRWGTRWMRDVEVK